MIRIKAIFEGGAFHVKDSLGIEEGSCVDLEIKKVHPLGAAQEPWRAQSLSDLEKIVLRKYESFSPTNLEELTIVIQKYMRYETDDPSLLQTSLGDLKQAGKNLLDMGYIEAIAPGSEVLRVSPMGKVLAVPMNQARETARRRARGKKPPRRGPLPVIDHFVSTFDELDIAFLDFSMRTYNALKASGIDTIGSLCGLARRELGRLKGIGSRSVDEAETALWRIGLELQPGEKRT